jgi:hypothetical protein
VWGIGNDPGVIGLAMRPPHHLQGTYEKRVRLLNVQCRANKGNGEPCRAPAVAQHGYCWNHAPENAERRRRIASRGGRAKANREVSQLKDEIKTVISEVKGGVLDRNDAAVMIQGYRALKDFIALERQVKETDELAAEIEELKREHGVA